MSAPKKLIEVALPLEAISAACVADKNRKTGTIRNLHKWFAPMPSPAWRAILFAALVDDPGEEKGRAELLRHTEALVSAGAKAPKQHVLDAAQRAIARSLDGELPTVVDPFCGGGSTLLEAQRLGLPAAGSDLNPVAVLISRTLAGIAPTMAGRGPVTDAGELASSGTDLSGFLHDVRHYSTRVYDEAQEQIGHHYPPGPDGGPARAWIWARTVRCPNPACRAIMPLLSSMWLNKKSGEFAWLRPVVQGREVDFEIGEGTGGPPPAPKVGDRGGNFRCLVCGEVAPERHVRDEGLAGRLGLQLVAVAATEDGKRVCRPADERHREAADLHVPGGGPDEQLAYDPRNLWCVGYGLTRHADLYTPRQLLSLETFSALVAEVPGWLGADGADDDYAAAVATVLGLCVGKLAQASSTLVRWRTREGPAKAEPIFGRHDLPMVWDFAETNPFGGSVGDWQQTVTTSLRAFGELPSAATPATVVQLDARHVAERLPARCLIATDPPYFDNIGYADLSDYFYVWIRRALRYVQPDLFATILTPKDDELVALPGRHGGDKDAAKDYFVEGFGEVFDALASSAHTDFPILIVYAYRQQESELDGQSSTGWEAMLQALLSVGLAIVGTWPIHGTGGSRQIGLGFNALATYVLLVCRPRLATAGVADRRQFVSELRAELPGSLRALQEGAIAPVDLAQAAIGPGMAIFSRHVRVLDPEGSPLTVRAALNLINQVLAEVLEEQEGEFDSDTRWAIAWFEQHGLQEGPYGVAETLSTAKVTSVRGLEEAGIVLARGGKVRLLRRDELDETWDPAQDRRLTRWEVAQHLIRALESGGEMAAADLARRLGGLGESARDLAYRLYAVCERRGWAQEALGYNALVASWPEISRLAAGEPDAEQASLL